MSILTPENVYRFYETDGVPESGKHDPSKAGIVQLLNLLFGVSRGGWVVAKTRAALLAVTPTHETDGGVVLADTNPAYNGYYNREAAAWVRARGFPDTLARLTVVGGSANAVQATSGSGVDPSIVTAFFIDIATANTGNVTISINGAAAIPALNLNGDQFAAGEFDGRIFLSNEGTSLRALADAASAASAAASAALAEFWASEATAATIPDGSITAEMLEPGLLSDDSGAGQLFGLTLQNNVTDANNDINVLSGTARDIANTVTLELTSTRTKRLDAVWASGNNQGGLDAGSKANSTAYHVWVIGNGTLVDVLFSTSATAPTMPSGYTTKRRIGAILTDGSGNIRPFIQTGGWFTLKTPIALAWGDFSGSSALLKTLPVPIGVKLRLRLLSALTSASSSSGYVVISDPDLGAPTNTDNAVMYQSNGVTAATVEVWCDAAGRLYVFAEQSTVITSAVRLNGWYDIRDTSV